MARPIQVAHHPRGRAGRQVEWGSDDEDGNSYYEYEDLGLPAHRSHSRVGIKIVEDRAASPARFKKPNRPAATLDDRDVIINNHLNIPQGYRPRAASTGATPQPIFLNIPQPAREPSRERYKHYHTHRHEYSDSSEDDCYRSSSKHRRRRSKHRYSGESLDPEIAEKLARLKLMEEQQKSKQYDPSVAERLARLKAMEDKKERDEEEAAIIARIEDRKRKEKQREEQLRLEYEEQKRRVDEAEREAFAKAEAKRAKRDADQKAEAERFRLAERERSDKEKKERQRIIAEARAREEEEKKEAEEERKRILVEEEVRQKKAKEEREAVRKRVLAEEEERRAKEKARKEKEDEEFNQKVKEKFMRAGYSPEYIEDILKEKKEKERRPSDHGRRLSSRTQEHRLAIDMSRPTYIRVKLEHLYPETLDAYSLPWEYDPSDAKYIFIKRYVSHELQQELFEHTQKLRIKREKRLITDGYTKETITTLKPNNVYKDKDEMFVVRRKSMSKSPARRSWMFT